MQALYPWGFEQLLDHSGEWGSHFGPRKCSSFCPRNSLKTRIRESPKWSRTYEWSRKVRWTLYECGLEFSRRSIFWRFGNDDDDDDNNDDDDDDNNDVRQIGIRASKVEVTDWGMSIPAGPQKAPISTQELHPSRMSDDTVWITLGWRLKQRRHGWTLSKGQPFNNTK